VVAAIVGNGLNTVDGLREGLLAIWGTITAKALLLLPSGSGQWDWGSGLQGRSATFHHASRLVWADFVAVAQGARDTSRWVQERAMSLMVTVGENLCKIQ
jgi:hypothetical protein